MNWIRVNLLIRLGSKEWRTAMIAPTVNPTALWASYSALSAASLHLGYCSPSTISFPKHKRLIREFIKTSKRAMGTVQCDCMGRRLSVSRRFVATYKTTVVAPLFDNHTCCAYAPSGVAVLNRNAKFASKLR